VIARVNPAIHGPCPSCGLFFSGQAVDFHPNLQLPIIYIVEKAFLGPRCHLILIDLFPRLLHLIPENL
jgi:hypothetical protein